MKLHHHAYAVTVAIGLGALACQPQTMPASAQGQATHPVIQVPGRPTLLPYRAAWADAPALSALSDRAARLLPMPRSPRRT